jgi:DNA-binding transcriptional ArsR family regulator
MGREPGADANRTLVDAEEIEPLFAALEDGDCREILRATSTESLSASELSEACELPLSTTYRKVDALTEAGLLEENIRLSTSGKHTSEYSLRVENLQLTLGGENGVELEITERTGTDRTAPLLASAD